MRAKKQKYEVIADVDGKLLVYYCASQPALVNRLLEMGSLQRLIQVKLVPDEGKKSK